jgi:hypothetical protein
MSSLAVAVVSYNTRDLLRACLASVLADGAHEVVVVDNESRDGSAAMVRREFPGVLVVDDLGNRGYGAAGNAALARCTAPHVLLLNADTTVHRGALAALADHLDRHPRAAIVGPRLTNPDGTWQLSCFPFPGTLGWLVENDPVAALAGRVPFVRRRLLRFAPPVRPAAVPWVLGAALAIRREAFAAVGGFDESFFMYFEEVDLCRRLTDAGWEIHVLPAAQVTHVGGASTGQVRTPMLVQHYRSTQQYYRRHTRGPRLAAWLGVMRLKMAARLVSDGVALALRPDPPAELRHRVEAWRAALRE